MMRNKFRSKLPINVIWLPLSFITRICMRRFPIVWPFPRASLPRLGELSDEELKVVELVRAGMKNREISERIFVSLRTVELRLTAVYRKLGVGSRTELVSRLAGNPRLAAV